MSNQATPGMAWRDIAASAYRAYAASTGNKNYRGEPMPDFADLPDAIKTAWQAAVRQANECYLQGDDAKELEQSWAGWTAP